MGQLPALAMSGMMGQLPSKGIATDACTPMALWHAGGQTSWRARLTFASLLTDMPGQAPPHLFPQASAATHPQHAQTQQLHGAQQHAAPHIKAELHSMCSLPLAAAPSAQLPAGDAPVFDVGGHVGLPRTGISSGPGGFGEGLRSAGPASGAGGLCSRLLLEPFAGAAGCGGEPSARGTAASISGLEPAMLLDGDDGSDLGAVLGDMYVNGDASCMHSGVDGVPAVPLCGDVGLLGPDGCELGNGHQLNGSDPTKGLDDDFLAWVLAPST
jgi:hypothetical protein